MQSPETKATLVEVMRVCGLDGRPEAFEAASEAVVEILTALGRLPLDHSLDLTQRRIRSIQRRRPTQTSARSSPRPGTSRISDRADKSA